MKNTQFQKDAMILYVKKFISKLLHINCKDDHEFALVYNKLKFGKLQNYPKINWQQINNMFGASRSNQANKYFHEVFISNHLPPHTKHEMEEVRQYVRNSPIIAEIREASEYGAKQLKSKLAKEITSQFQLKRPDRSFKKIQDMLRSYIQKVANGDDNSCSLSLLTLQLQPKTSTTDNQSKYYSDYTNNDYNDYSGSFSFVSEMQYI